MEKRRTRRHRHLLFFFFLHASQSHLPLPSSSLIIVLRDSRQVVPFFKMWTPQREEKKCRIIQLIFDSFKHTRTQSMIQQAYIPRTTHAEMTTTNNKTKEIACAVWETYLQRGEWRANWFSVPCWPDIRTGPRGRTFVHPSSAQHNKEIKKWTKVLKPDNIWNLKQQTTKWIKISFFFFVCVCVKRVHSHSCVLSNQYVDIRQTRWRAKLRWGERIDF